MDEHIRPRSTAVLLGDLYLRLLMFHVGSFWYRPFSSIVSADGFSFDESILVWIQSEDADNDHEVAVLRKMVKNIRWLATKAECKNVILHSFAHLGDKKADSLTARHLIDETASRLKEREFTVHIVPEGLNEFKMHVLGQSLAKVFKRF